MSRDFIRHVSGGVAYNALYVQSIRSSTMLYADKRMPGSMRGKLAHAKLLKGGIIAIFPGKSARRLALHALPETRKSRFVFDTSASISNIFQL